MLMLDEVLRHFKPLNQVVLASVEKDQPRLRPVTLVYSENRFFFATQSSDNKVEQLTHNSKIELILQWQEPPNNGYIRLEGLAVKLEDEKLVSELYKSNDFMGKLWSSPVDPDLTVYEITPNVYDYLKPGEWSTHKLKIK